MGFIKSLFTGNDKTADANFLTLAEYDATAQGANIVATALLTLAAVTPANTYSVGGIITVTQAATTSSTLPSIVITYTDADSGTAMSLTLTATSTGNALTTFASAESIINAKPGTAINVSTTGYVSTGATPMQYAVHVTIQGR